MAKKPDKRNRDGDDDLKPAKGKGQSPRPHDEELIEAVSDVDVLEEVEEIEEAPPSPKKTRLAQRATQPTMLAKAEDEEAASPKAKAKIPAATPNLSLDDPKDAPAVLDEAAEEVFATTPSSNVLHEVLEAAPASDVFAAEVEDKPASTTGSSVVDAAELVEDVEDVEDVLADEVIELKPGVGSSQRGPETPPGVEPRSGAKAESPSGSVFAEEVVEFHEPGRGREAPSGSLDVFSAEVEESSGLSAPASASRHDADEVDLFTDDSAVKPTLGPATPAKVKSPDSVARPKGDDILGEDAFQDEADADASSMHMKKPAKKKSGADDASVLDVAETIPMGSASSAIRFEDIAEASDVKQKKDDETIAFDINDKKGSASGLGQQARVARDRDLADDQASGIDVDVPAHSRGRVAREGSSADIDFDDLVTEEEVDPSGKSGLNLAKNKAKAKDGESEEGGADLFADNEGPARKKPKAQDEVEEILDADDVEEPLGASGRGGTALKKPPRPKYGRRWLGGIILGMLLAIGGVAAIGYFNLALIEGLIYSSEALNRKKDKDPAAKAQPLTASLQARQQMEEGKFDQAIELLKDADSTSVNLATRAEARWLKYLEDNKGKINPKDAEFKQVMADLTEAKNIHLKNQIQNTVIAQGTALDLTKKLQGNEKVLADLRAHLKKAKLDDKDLSAAVAEALAANQANVQLVETIADALMKGKFIDAKDKLDAASFQKILKDLHDKQSTLAAVNKLLEDAMLDTGDKGVTALVTAQKDALDKLGAVNKLLDEDKIKGRGAKGLQELIEARKKLSADRDGLDKAIKAAYQELADAKIVPADADPRAKLAEGTKLLRQKAESPLALPLSALAGSLSGLGTGAGGMLQKGFDTTALLAELTFFRAREPLLRGPDKNMDGFIAQLQIPGKADATTLAAATKEAKWVIANEQASAEARAKAYLVLGLIQRNQENFAEARKHLETALKHSEGLQPAPWIEQTDGAVKDLKDPASYYLPKADQLAAAGKLQAAHDLLSLGLKAMPNNGPLLAHRAQVRLETVRGKAPVEVAQTIRSDAEAAAKDPVAAAPAAYVLGQLEENLGNWAKAETYYRQALKSHKGDADDASRYRAALARTLLRDPPAAVAPPVEPKGKDKGKKKDADPKVEDTSAEQVRLDLAVETLLLYALVGVQPGTDDEEDPATAARIKESIDLAQELIKSANPKVKGQGYILLAQAIAKQGKRTESLKEFSKGLELLYPGMATKEMTKLIEEHPAFQQPDVAKQANPYLAEQFFGRGLHLYFDKKYAPAEQQFQQAVKYFGQDARYRYFLGLAQLAQKTKLKRDAAYVSFEEGARLEAANRPLVVDINGSLERIQGPLRSQLNAFREKAVEKGEE